MPAISAWTRLPNVSIALACLWALVSPTNGLPGEPEVLTQISQLRTLPAAGQRSCRKVRLEAIVLFSDPIQSRLALQDSSGAVIVKIDRSNRNLSPGDKALIEGMCGIEGDDIDLGSVAVVDNDGVHAAKEKSGKVFLSAGRHRLRLDWFDSGGDLKLEAYYEGPGVLRQPIPSDRLFHQTGSRDAPQWGAGLQYWAYEGEWASLTNFSQTVVVKQGVTDNFDLSVRSRTNNVALEFCGFIEIPSEGVYTFSTISDDGSKLYLDEEPVRFEILGTNSLPVPRKIALGQPISERPEWVQTEGKVMFAGRTLNGWDLDLRAGGQQIEVQLPDVQGNLPEGLLHNEIRVTGVAFSTATSDGAEVAGTLVAPGIEYVCRLQAGPEQWATPLSPIAQLHNSTNANRFSDFFHVRAKVQSCEIPGWVRLADDSGEVLAKMSAPFNSLPAGWIEVYGQLTQAGTNLRLSECVYRLTGPTETPDASPLPVLTTIEQVHRLKRSEAERGYPVLIRGVVTCAWTWNVNGMIHDGTRGIFVPNLGPGSAPTAHFGDYLELEGHTASGDFAPVIEATRVTRLGRGRLPEPVKPTWDQLLNGSMDCQFVEMEGVVSSIQPAGFSLLMRGGRLTVELDEWNAAALKQFENARVRVRGSLSALWNGETHQVTSGRVLLHAIAISIDERAPADLFAIPSKTIEELAQFDAEAGTLQRVKLNGQVIQARHGEYFLMAGTNGARFLAKQPNAAAVGDRVEVVGFPELEGPSPLLRDATVRRLGSAPLPPPRKIGSEIADNSLDATRVQMQARVLGVRREQTSLALDVRDALRTYVARLEGLTEAVPVPPVGSFIRLTGTYSARESDNRGSFELLLNRPADIEILQSPSWWTVRHALGLAGMLTAVLFLAIGWIRSLRGKVHQRTAELQTEIEHHKRTEAEVKEKAKLLGAEIEERKRIEQEVERVHKQLLLTSRQAGMAEVATSILHNVGNVLNSVNVSAGVVAENLRQSKGASVLKVAELLANNTSNPGFLAGDEKGKQIPGFLRTLGERLSAEQQANAIELRDLQSNIEHIKRIVAMQQDYARVGGIVEKVRVSDLVEDSVRMNSSALSRHGVGLVRDVRADPELLIEKHKVLQILINLIQNAKFACVEAERTDGRITVSIPPVSGNRVQIHIIDNGTGITEENLKRIFSPGFTTRKNGHGFGLHGCILAAKELKGALRVESQGPGQGATFTLELPLTLDGKDSTNP